MLETNEKIEILIPEEMREEVEGMIKFITRIPKEEAMYFFGILQGAQFALMNKSEQ